jgi:hypothetical protein
VCSDKAPDLVQPEQARGIQRTINKRRLNYLTRHPFLPAAEKRKLFPDMREDMKSISYTRNQPSNSDPIVHTTKDPPGQSSRPKTPY